MAARYLLLILCLLIAQVAFAQAERKYRWEIEFHASGFLKDDAKGGVKTLPGPGTSFATVAPNVNSRTVSSFLFGDGNALINQVLMGQGLNPIVPLDATILNNRQTLERQSNIGVGVRLARYVGRHVWLDGTVEYDIDYDHGSFEIGEREEQQALLTMRTWRQSLESLFGICGPLCNNSMIESVVTTHEKGHQVASAVTVNYDLRREGRFIPYVGGGGGLVFSFAGTPHQEYFGHYSLRSDTIQGSDHVRVDFQVPPVVPALILATGARYQIGNRWGLRMEMRNNFESHSYKTLVTAMPVFTDGGAGNAFVLSSGDVGIQFSNSQSFAPSTLSKPLRQVRTFKSTGLRYEGRISGGVYYRF